MTTTKWQPTERTWESYELPWGACEVAPYRDDRDRVIVRYADMPVTFENSEGDPVNRPRMARGTDTAHLFVVYSWMNERPMFLISEDGGGSDIAWEMCAECKRHFRVCTCAGISEPNSVKWARERQADQWVNRKDAAAARHNRAAEEALARAAETAADDEPDEKPQKRARGGTATGTRKGATKGTTKRTGRASATQKKASTGTRRRTVAEPEPPADEDVPTMTLSEVDAAAGDAADAAVEAAMSNGRATKRSGTTRRTGSSGTKKSVTSSTKRSTAPRRKRT